MHLTASDRGPRCRHETYDQPYPQLPSGETIDQLADLVAVAWVAKLQSGLLVGGVGKKMESSTARHCQELGSGLVELMRFEPMTSSLSGMRASPLTSPATWAFVIARSSCLTPVAQSPGSQSAKGGYPGTRTTRWEAGGDGTRSTLLPLWEWLDSSEADTMPRCHPANPASGSEEGGIVCFQFHPIRTLIPRG